MTFIEAIINILAFTIMMADCMKVLKYFTMMHDKHQRGFDNFFFAKWINGLQFSTQEDISTVMLVFIISLVN